jgi:membrane fusion protein, multidrug efflux system
MVKKENAVKERKKKKAFIPFFVLFVAVIVFGGIWYTRYLKYVNTDDALVDGDNVALAAKIMGRVAAIYAREGDSVKANQLLVLLDTADIYAQKLQAEAQVNQALANLVQAESKYNADVKNINVFKINADKSKSDFERAQRQRNTDVISQEQFENIAKANQTSNAQLLAAQAMLKVSSAQVNSARAAIENAKAMVNVISTQMQNTRLFSSFDGIIAKRWLEPGDIAQMGQTILTINNNTNLWVSVYIEETKLKYLHIGQEAEFTIDAIPNAVFTGKLFYIGNNTASRFSLIPPSNASGNFTKITQRVQLKVSIDGVNNEKLSHYKLFPGMSAIMKLHK